MRRKCEVTIELRRATESSFNRGRGVIIYTDVVVVEEASELVSGLLLINSLAQNLSREFGFADEQNGFT